MTRSSTATSPILGRPAGNARTSASIAIRASITPRAPPVSEGSRSRSLPRERAGCDRHQRRQHRESRWRASARASSRFTIFAHAMSRTRPTAACSTQSSADPTKDLVRKRRHLQQVAVALPARHEDVAVVSASGGDAGSRTPRFGQRVQLRLGRSDSSALSFRRPMR